MKCNYIYILGIKVGKKVIMKNIHSKRTEALGHKTVILLLDNN